MIKIATIGTSKITEQFINSVKLTDGIEHAAVYSRSEDTGRAFADNTGCGRVFTDLEALANDEGINAVYIASPNLFHGGQTRLFLEHGKNVICEKPIAVSCKEYDELKALADSKGLVYMEAITSRHSSTREPIKAALKEIGKIHLARIDYSQFSKKFEEIAEGKNPNMFNMKLHAGTLMDLGVYCVYGTLDLLGIPKSITATASFLENGCDISGCAIFDYGDFPCAVTYCKGGETAFGSEIIGEKGTLTIRMISQYANVVLWQEVNKNNFEKKTVICEKQPRPELMAGETRAFVNYVTEPEKYKAEYDEVSALTHAVHDCMDKIKASAKIEYK